MHYFSFFTNWSNDIRFKLIYWHYCYLWSLVHEQWCRKIDNWGAIFIFISVFWVINFFRNLLFSRYVNTNIWIWASPIINRPMPMMNNDHFMRWTLPTTSLVVRDVVLSVAVRILCPLQIIQIKNSAKNSS